MRLFVEDLQTDLQRGDNVTWTPAPPGGSPLASHYLLRVPLLRDSAQAVDEQPGPSAWPVPRLESPVRLKRRLARVPCAVSVKLPTEHPTCCRCP